MMRKNLQKFVFNVTDKKHVYGSKQEKNGSNVQKRSVFFHIQQRKPEDLSDARLECMHLQMGQKVQIMRILAGSFKMQSKMALQKVGRLHIIGVYSEGRQKSLLSFGCEEDVLCQHRDYNMRRR